VPSLLLTMPMLLSSYDVSGCMLGLSRWRDFLAVPTPINRATLMLHCQYYREAHRSVAPLGDDEFLGLTAQFILAADQDQIRVVPDKCAPIYSTLCM
jgi:hypothetical protein